MRKIFLFLIVALISLFTASAACSDLRACQNQNDKFYCSPDDTSCTYIKFTQSLTCVIDASFTDSDTDQDGWTDNCDALPNDVLEWFDMDGDGFGHVYDCNDFDNAIGENCDPDDDEQTNEQEHDAGTNPNVNNNGGGSRLSISICTGKWDCTEWTECEDGAKTRICTSSNGCENNRPNEWQGCPNYVTLDIAPKEEPNQPELTTPEVEIIDSEEPQETEPGNRLTGQVFNTEPGNFKPASLWLLLLLIMLIIGGIYWKKKNNKKVYTL
jgi:hypothetical protein